MENKTQDKLWNSSYIMMLCVSTVTATGFSMVLPIIVKYAISLGATVAIAGTIAGIFSITALIGRPISGFIADRFDKKRIMFIATIVLALSTLGYGLSTSYSMLLVFRVIHGLAFSISGTASITLGTTFIPKDRLGEGVGFLGIGFVLSRAIGPNIGIVLLENFGYEYVFFGAAAIIVVSAVMITLLKYKHEKKEVKKKENGEKFKLKLSDFVAKELLVLAAIVGCFSMMNGLISSFLVNLGEQRNILGIGIYFTINAVVLLVIRPFAGKLLDKKGLAYIAYPAFAMGMIAAFILGIASALWMIVVSAIFYAIGQGASQPSFQATCIKKLGPKRVGVATSTYYIGADIGQGVGPIIGGTIAGAFGFNSVYFFGMIVLFLGVTLFYFYNRREKLKQAEQAELADAEI